MPSDSKDEPLTYTEIAAENKAGNSSDAGQQTNEPAMTSAEAVALRKSVSEAQTLLTTQAAEVGESRAKIQRLESEASDRKALDDANATKAGAQTLEEAMKENPGFQALGEGNRKTLLDLVETAADLSGNKKIQELEAKVQGLSDQNRQLSQRQTSDDYAGQIETAKTVYGEKILKDYAKDISAHLEQTGGAVTLDAAVRSVVPLDKLMAAAGRKKKAADIEEVSSRGSISPGEGGGSDEHTPAARRPRAGASKKEKFAAYFNKAVANHS